MVRLDSGGLGAGLEGVGQAALAAVLAVLVEGHLFEQVSQSLRIHAIEDGWDVRRYRHRTQQKGTRDEDA